MTNFVGDYQMFSLVATAAAKQLLSFNQIKSDIVVQTNLSLIEELNQQQKKMTESLYRSYIRMMF